MFESLSHLALQQYWWVIVSLLGSILVFLMFVQGGQTLLYSLAKNEDERTLLVTSLGRKWEFTFTTLVVFGGAFFASFPLFYSTSFGGAYWVWILILLCFVLQAVSYEYRLKKNVLIPQKAFEYFLLINGVLGTVLIGTAVGTFFNGSEFSVGEMNFSRWETPWHGLEAALNFHNLSLGLAVFFLARTLALLYFINDVDNAQIVERARKQLWCAAIAFVAFFLIFLIWLMFKDGFAYDENGRVFMEEYKYFNNLLAMPAVLILLLLGVVAVLFGIIKTLFVSGYRCGIWLTGIGTVLAVISLFFLAGFNNTCFYPSTFDLQSSLNIQNSSSSPYTLTVMSYVSLAVPFVLAYIVWAWRAMNKKQISIDELKEKDNEVY